MANLYSKIHRLKALGWTWEQFLTEIGQQHPAGLEEKTLKALYRQPHRKAPRHASELIEAVHNQYFPSPFPADVEALMRVYANLMQCNKHGSTDSDVADLRLFLDGVMERTEKQEYLRLARLHWLQANMHFDQLPALRTGSRKSLLETTQQRAIDHYQQSLELIEQHSEAVDRTKVSEFTLYKLRQNILVCYLNIVAPEQRFEDEAVLKHLQESDFLPRSKVVMEEEPYQWVVARNGLRFSSITRNEEDCRWFYQALVKANKSFAKLEYVPLAYPAISDSPEFAWAIEQVLVAEGISFNGPPRLLNTLSIPQKHVDATYALTYAS